MALPRSARAFGSTIQCTPAFVPPSSRTFPSLTHASWFSMSSTCSAKGGDRNKRRGVSALRRTGPRFNLSVSKEPLPRPVLDPAKRSKPKIKDNHGLWDFFNSDRKAMATPEQMASHGRSWTVNELRYKSFEDLHSLWWVCLRELNRIHTLENERERVEAGYGHSEASDRMEEVRRTQKSIKWVLTERWYAWEDAKRIEKASPERAAELMGVPIDSFVDSDVTDENLPVDKGLDPSDFEETSTETRPTPAIR